MVTSANNLNLLLHVRTLSHDRRLVMQVLSFPTTEILEDIVLHLCDTFVKVYSAVKVNGKRRNTVHFNLSGTSVAVLFFLTSLCTIGLAESHNRDLDKKKNEPTEFSFVKVYLLLKRLVTM